MDHIEKMAEVICRGQFEQIGYDCAAQTAFDALMDAVPDLVWGNKKTYEKGKGGAGFSISAKSLFGTYLINFFEFQDKFLVELALGEIPNTAKNIEDAKAAANARHRELAREIWGGKSDG